MRFPTIMGRFLSDKTTTDVVACLIYILQHNASLNVKIVNASPTEIAFNVLPSHFLERNSFLPNVHVVVKTDNGNSICMFEYSLKRETRVFLTIFIVIALVLEGLLLLFVKELASLLLLLIPIGLIISAAILTICSLYVFSMQIQSVFAHVFNISSKQLLTIVFRAKQQRE